MYVTCPATAKPSARREDVIQTCRHIWNAAIGVEPSRAANDAAKVTQNVAAITLPSSSTPRPNHQSQWHYVDCISVHRYTIRKNPSLWHKAKVAKTYIILGELIKREETNYPLPFLRNRRNCRSLRLGGRRSTSFINLNRRIRDIKYL